MGETHYISQSAPPQPALRRGLLEAVRAMAIGLASLALGTVAVLGLLFAGFALAGPLV